jgi:hypothetical protein
MFRKLMCVGVAVLTLAAPLALMPTARADYVIPVLVSGHRHCYQVLYRARHRGPWLLHATTFDRHAARHMAHHLRASGFQVRIVRG